MAVSLSWITVLGKTEPSVRIRGIKLFCLGWWMVMIGMALACGGAAQGETFSEGTGHSQGADDKNCLQISMDEYFRAFFSMATTKTKTGQIDVNTRIGKDWRVYISSRASRTQKKMLMNPIYQVSNLMGYSISMVNDISKANYVYFIRDELEVSDEDEVVLSWVKEKFDDTTIRHISNAKVGSKISEYNGVDNILVYSVVLREDRDIEAYQNMKCLLSYDVKSSFGEYYSTEFAENQKFKMFMSCKKRNLFNLFDTVYFTALSRIKWISFENESEAKSIMRPVFESVANEKNLQKMCIHENHEQ